MADAMSPEELRDLLQGDWKLPDDKVELYLQFFQGLSPKDQQTLGDKLRSDDSYVTDATTPPSTDDLWQTLLRTGYGTSDSVNRALTDFQHGLDQQAQIQQQADEQGAAAVSPSTHDRWQKVADAYNAWNTKRATAAGANPPAAISVATQTDIDKLSEWAKTYYAGGSPFDASGNYDPTRALPQDKKGDPLQPAEFDYSQMREQDADQIFKGSARTQYQHYLDGWNKTHRDDSVNDSLRGKAMQPQTFDEFAQKALRSVYGIGMDVVQKIALVYGVTKGHEMSPELRAQLMKKIADMQANDPEAITKMTEILAQSDEQGGGPASSASSLTPITDAQYQKFEQILNDGSSFNGVFKWMTTDINAYDTAHPQAADVKRAQDKNIEDTIMKALNRPATAADYAALEGKSDAEISAWLDRQVLGNGMTYGAYNAAHTRLDKMWERYFGQSPDDATLKSFATKSDSDINNFINSSNSHIPGITIGQYESYGKTFDKLSQQYYGTTNTQLYHEFLDSQVKGADAGK